jgi:pSer/pThr/pTyr-binding forkhead associated (FHA) protein
MTAILICRSGSLRGQKLKLKKERIRLGRSAGNDLVLADEVVSGSHAEIRREGESYTLLDLDSTNGTLLNGTPVQRARLKNRDRIELGEGGPLIEFSSGGEEQDTPPTLRPLSGTWEKGMRPIPLQEGSTTLGRSVESHIVVGRAPGSVVSSRHAVILVRSDTCELVDQDSSNGTFVNGKRVRKATLHDGDRVELGSGGPAFEFCRSGTRRRFGGEQEKESERMFRKLERAAKGGRAGEQTMLFLQAANRYYKRRRWPLLALSGVILTVALITGYLYYLKERENQRIRASAEDLFYRMRTIEAQLVRQRDTMPPAEFERLTNERRRQEQDYDQFLKNLGAYEGKTPVQRNIMRLSRRLGETDLEVPADFYQTTLAYVEKWRGTSRLRAALDRARQRNLLQIIRTALDQYGLPREFIFIPLQESNYDATSVGRPTNYGIAKGMWQLIPLTALDYHLRLGPLKDLPQYDPSDQRHEELASTQAAVRYLAYLYSTKAAASGLLVMASYNYGQVRIIRKLDELPNDPRQRSFWNFYRNGWIPSETRDYVMSVFSAALICEKPDLFQMNIEPVGW